jgi:predicted PurR-regulated permease PerM
MPELIKRETLLVVALLLLFAAVFALFYRIMAPFFVPIAWAAVLVVTVQPLYDRLRPKFKRRGVSALIMTALVSVVIIGPITYLIIALVGEATDLYSKVQEGLSQHPLAWIDIRNHPLVQGLLKSLDGVVDTSQWDLQGAVTNALKEISGFVVANTAAFLTNMGRAIFHFVLVLLTMYYLFKDGDKLIEQVKESIPLLKDQSGQMLARLTDVVRATIYGGLVVAAIQGALGGIMFWILGIPSPVFWGTMMGFLSLIPVLGAFVVYIPAAIILALSGAYVKAIILVAFGTVVVSQIDNFLKPVLISGRTQLHPLLLFFSILGGLQVFGFLGLILGPVVAAVFVAIFELYRETLREPKPRPPPPPPPPQSAGTTAPERLDPEL